MRGLGWIREQRQAEAQELRDQIGQLETDLISAANNYKGKWKLHDVAHALRWSKERLKLLEECIDQMPRRH